MNFIGDHSRIQQIVRSFDKVAEGNGPQVLALVGDRGSGKTRTVVEAFQNLSTREQAATGSKFWPTQLNACKDNLSLGPDLSACQLEDPVPFFWWPIRLPDPGSRNAGTAHLDDNLLLAVQLRNYRDAQDSAHLKLGRHPVIRALIGQGEDKVLDLAISQMVQVATQAGINVLTGMVPAGGLVKGVAQALVEVWKVRRAENQLKADGPNNLQLSKIPDLTEELLRSFQWVFDRSPHIPLVMVVDDIQFSGHEGSESVLLLVDKFLRRAEEKCWPLLLVVTCWKKEWYEQSHEEEQEQGEAHSPNIGAAISRFLKRQHQDPDAVVINLNPANLGLMANAASQIFPGLSTSQAMAIAERSGGNFLFFDTLVKVLNKPRNFQGLDPKVGELNADGEALVCNQTFELHQFVETRLSEDPEVRWAAAVSSQLGQVFLPEFSKALGHLLHRDCREEALSTLERPLFFTKHEEDGSSRFIQRLYWEVAHRQSLDLATNEQYKAGILQELRSQLSQTDPEKVIHPVLLEMASHCLRASAAPKDLRLLQDVLAWQIVRQSQAGDRASFKSAGVDLLQALLLGELASPCRSIFMAFPWLDLDRLVISGRNAGILDDLGLGLDVSLSKWLGAYGQRGGVCILFTQPGQIDPNRLKSPHKLIEVSNLHAKRLLTDEAMLETSMNLTHRSIRSEKVSNMEKFWFTRDHELIEKMRREMLSWGD